MKKKIIREWLETTPADIEFQDKIKQWIIPGTFMFTFWMILIVNFLFWLFR